MQYSLYSLKLIMQYFLKKSNRAITYVYLLFSQLIGKDEYIENNADRPTLNYNSTPTATIYQSSSY